MNDLSRENLDELLDEVSKPAFDRMLKVLKALEKAEPHVSSDIEDRQIEYERRIFMNETERKLLRAIKGFNFSREQLALLLIDEREIYRKVAKKYLEELDNEQI